MPKIVGWPKTSGTFQGPTLFLTGANSTYVRPSNHTAILRQFPNATFTSIPDAGHWLHAENPREFEDAVRAFLNG